MASSISLLRQVETGLVALQVLHETAAPKLNESDLYTLFVEELKLVRGEREGDEGNVANALRQFVYQFMKDKAVS